MGALIDSGRVGDGNLYRAIVLLCGVIYVLSFRSFL